MSRRNLDASNLEAVIRLLDQADHLLLGGADGLARACELAGRASRLIGLLPSSSLVEHGIRRRHSEMQMRMLDLLQSIDAEDLRGRVLGALSRLGQGASTGAVHREVLARIALREEARVQFLHMLGKDMVWSWPDHHAEHEVSRCLSELCREGLVVCRRSLAFWLGPVWSQPTNRVPAE